MGKVYTMESGRDGVSEREGEYVESVADEVGDEVGMVNGINGLVSSGVDHGVTVF